MNNQYSLIIFDWDGTLYDSVTHVANTLKKAVTSLNLPMFNESEYEELSGLAIDHVINALYADFSEKEREQLKARYRLQALIDQKEVTLYPQTREVLAKLREEHYDLAIATGKSAKGLAEDLMLLNIGDWFVATRTADQTFSKPNPKMLYQIMDMLNVSPRKTLMVGDSVVDIQMALNAEVDAIGIHSDATQREILLSQGAKKTIATLSELLVYLLG